MQDVSRLGSPWHQSILILFRPSWGRGGRSGQQKTRLPAGCKTSSRILTKALNPPTRPATLIRRKMLHNMDTATSVTIREMISLKRQKQDRYKLKLSATTRSTLLNTTILGILKVLTFRLQVHQRADMTKKMQHSQVFIYKKQKTQQLHNLKC